MRNEQPIDFFAGAETERGEIMGRGSERDESGKLRQERRLVNNNEKRTIINGRAGEHF